MFTDNEYTLISYNKLNIKGYISLIKEIFFIKKSLRFHILNIIIKIFNNLKSELVALQLIEIKREFLDILIYFLQIGFIFF
jgi:hypothetical protein